MERTTKHERINPSQFKGVIVPTITPFLRVPLNNMVVDEGSQKSLIEYVLRNGAHSIFLGSNAGEGRAMNMDEWKTSIKSGIASVRNNVNGDNIPVMVGALRENLDEVIECANYADKLGADAIVISPIYGAKDENEAQERLDKVLKATDESKIPLIIYNNPDFQLIEGRPANLSIDFIKRVVQENPDRIVAIKESSSGDLNIARIHELFAFKTEQGLESFKIFEGNTRNALQALHAGADGIVPYEANISPEVLVELFKNKNEGAMEKIIGETGVKTIIDAMKKAVKSVSPASKYPGSQTIKIMLKQKGIISTDEMFE